MDPNTVVPHGRSITISFRQALSLVSALFLLKTLHALTTVSTFGLRKKRNTSPPQWIMKTTGWTEQHILSIFLSTTSVSIYRRPRSPEPDGYSDAADALWLRGSAASSTLMTVHAPCQSPSPSFDIQHARTQNGYRYETDEDADADADVEAQLYPLGPMTVPDNFGSDRSDSESEREETTVDGDDLSPSPHKKSHSSDALKPATTKSALRYTKLVPGKPVYGSWSLNRDFSISSAGRRDLSLSSTASQNDAFALEVDKMQSANTLESYPGKFPVSGGLEYTSLATVPLTMKDGRLLRKPYTDG